ncbi:hypothetical protein Salat_2883400 [Sesamum alatum]|uniref:Uncharacterized protein n=1 Tax=Sesamum alatum TaxID=300844 RepID=A0AAE1XI34_9LAMI|nr:hypothetical protein Salat_2883400 [Sesamum alatum]
MGYLPRIYSKTQSPRNFAKGLFSPKVITSNFAIRAICPVFRQKAITSNFAIRAVCPVFRQKAISLNFAIRAICPVFGRKTNVSYLFEGYRLEISLKDHFAASHYYLGFLSEKEHRLEVGQENIPYFRQKDYSTYDKKQFVAKSYLRPSILIRRKII